MIEDTGDSPGKGSKQWSFRRPRTWTRSAGTTCRRREQWAELRWDLPELQYPQRLNCAAALLDDVVAEHGARPAGLHSPSETWSYGSCWPGPTSSRTS